MLKKFKMAWGIALLALAGAASADPFYLNPGVDYDPTGVNQACSTCSSIKEEFTIRYDSKTVVTDVDGSGGFSVGDTTVTSGGYVSGATSNNFGSLGRNSITSLVPKQIFTSDSDNGLNTNYYITFRFSNLQGVVTGVAANGLPIISYTSGLVELLYYDGTNLINFMDINITGGAIDGVGTQLNGTVDFTNVDSLTYANLFNSASYSCNGSNGFYDIWLNCGGATGALTIDFSSHFDTNPNVDTTVTANADGTITIVSNHDGSAIFSIPEPTSLALAGLSLLAVAGVNRRRNAKK